MSIAKRIQTYLDETGIDYETVAHPKTTGASQTAEIAHVPGDCLAKPVLVHHEEGFVMAVVPSSRRVDLQKLQSVIDRRLGLATEADMSVLFDDCEAGAIPAIGQPYGVTTLVDEHLDGHDAIWFEGGDHETLIKVSGLDFDRMTHDCRHAEFSCRAS